MMPTAYILIGIPASGKSTWVKNQKWSKDCVIASTDSYVEAFARSVNKSYTEVFNEIMPKAVEQMANDVVEAREAGKDIIWDQTSTTLSTRAKKIKMLDGYTKIAVVFKIPDMDVLKKRLASRPGKDVPWEIVSNMINNFEHPSLEEGFDQIWHAE